MTKHIELGQLSETAVTDYASFRSKLRSGDLLFASGNYPISQAIREFTKSPWSRVGLSFVLQEIDCVLLL